MAPMTATKTFAERQRDALIEQAVEHNNERRTVEALLIPDRPRNPHRLGEIVRLGDDYVAEIIRGDRVTWTTLIGGKTSSWHRMTQEAAVLHLIAQRYDPNPNSNVQAAFYAGRVLGIPEGDER